MEQQIPRQDRIYTYADYETWPDGERWELIDGVAYAMAPAPSPAHQDLVTQLARRIGNYLEGKGCKVYTAPVDVYLESSTGKDTVVQPDVVVVCDKDQIQPKGIFGAPTLVVEILSPSSVSRDLVKKRALYERHGVKEYWIVSPLDRSATRLSLEGLRYVEHIVIEQGALASLVLPDFAVDVEAIFAEAGGIQG